VIEKMIAGRMNKFYEEVTLLKQTFVVNPDLSVAEAAKAAGVTITGFVRLEVGEGIEKEEGDFAAEVAKVASGSAAARHRRLSAHDRAALRRPREIGARARRGDEGRQADPAGQPEGPVGGRRPGPTDIYRTGVLANVLQLLKLPDGTVKVLVEGKARVRIRLRGQSRVLRGARRKLPESLGDEAAVAALLRSVAEEFERYAKVKKNVPEEALSVVSETDGAGQAGRSGGRAIWASRSRRSRSCWKRCRSPSGWRRSMA
jgi:hypothetical protein